MNQYIEIRDVDEPKAFKSIRSIIKRINIDSWWGCKKILEPNIVNKRMVMKLPSVNGHYRKVVAIEGYNL